MSLQNKVVLVTGTNRGIGAAVVREFLKADVAKVYAAARSVASLPDFGDRRVVPLQLDVTSDASVAAAAGTATDLDILVNNAGTMAFGDWIATSQDAVEADMNVNYYGTLRVSGPSCRISPAVDRGRSRTSSASSALRPCRCWPATRRQRPPCSR